MLPTVSHGTFRTSRRTQQVTAAGDSELVPV